MQYGICSLSIVPLKLEPSVNSAMVNQVLYGEHFKILEKRGSSSRIRIAFDSCEGWIDNKQFLKISEEEYERINSEEPTLSADLIEFVSDEKQDLIPIPIGSVLNPILLLNHTYDGNKTKGFREKIRLINTAYLYLNSPYLWGGKTPFGIDSSGFTQMVYRLNGFSLPRSASAQSCQGESLSFIEESEAGDLAFFDNRDGIINHVGIIMDDNYIIHADGKVRIDRMDHSGIYNPDIGKHTHQLRVIKKII